MSSKLNAVPTVRLDETGVYKYIQIKVNLHGFYWFIPIIRHCQIRSFLILLVAEFARFFKIGLLEADDARCRFRSLLSFVSGYQTQHRANTETSKK